MPLLTQSWIQYLSSFSQLIVGYSGGLDSTVLLHELAQISFLKPKILVIHVHHGLSPFADEWLIHCKNFCLERALPFQSFYVSIPKTKNLEEQARIKRFDCFKSIMNSQSCLLLAHHQEDQMETMLLNLARGSGLKGLGGIRESLSFGSGFLAKPLLRIPKKLLTDYAEHNQLKYIEDESNFNTVFSRNYLRQIITPLLKEKWPKISQNFDQCSQHLKDSWDNLQELACMDYPPLMDNPLVINFKKIQQLPIRRLKNVLIVWFHRLDLQIPNTSIIQQILAMMDAREDAQPSVKWSSFQIKRYRDSIYLIAQIPQPNKSTVIWSAFPKPLLLNHKEHLVAVSASEGIIVPPQSQVEIRYRQGGETIRLRGKKRSLKKLLQEFSIPPWMRENIPLIYVNGQLAAVVDYCVQDVISQDESPIYQIERRKG